MADSKIKLMMGLEENVKAVAIVPGQLLFTTDTGKIHLDTVSGRVPLYKDVIDNVKTLQELVGSTSVATQIKNAIDALIAGGDPGEEVTLISGVTGGDGIIVDSVTNPAKPQINIRLATGNNALKVDENGALQVDPTELTDYSINVTNSNTDGLKRYTITQGELSFDLDIPADLIVSDSKVEVDPAGKPAGTYLVLTINGKTEYIDASTLVKAASAKNEEGAQAIVTVSANSEISVALSQEVKNSLALADSAVQASDLEHEAEARKYIAGISIGENGEITFVTGDLPEGTGALIWETF